MASDEDQWRAQFEKLGTNQVRALLLEWTGPLRGTANRWLSEKDQESARLEEASKAEEMALMRAANNAALEANSLARVTSRQARIANIIATMALIIATAALIVSIFKG